VGRAFNGRVVLARDAPLNMLSAARQTNAKRIINLSSIGFQTQI